MSKYDRYVITKPYFDRTVNSMKLNKVRFGQGANFTNPDEAFFIAGSAPFPDSPDVGIPKTLPIRPEEKGNYFIFDYLEQEEEEAHILSAWFSYAMDGVGSASAALNKVRIERKSTTSLYCKLVVQGTTEEIPSTSMNWNNRPAGSSEATSGNSETALDVFIASYGTHFVSLIKSGAAFVVQIKITSTDRTVSNQIQARLNAYGASGGFSEDDKQYFNQHGVQVKAILHGDSDAKGYISVITSLEDLKKLLDKFRDGSVKLVSIPIEFRCESYYRTLGGYIDLQKLFGPEAKVHVPIAYHGVPEGTILPWVPTQRYLRDGKFIQAPEGWAICNGLPPFEGAPPTPDLTNLFLRGPERTGESYIYNRVDINSKHTHPATTGENNQGVAHVSDTGSQYCSRPHNHSVTVEEVTALPPWYSVVYIIKLAAP